MEGSERVYRRREGLLEFWEDWHAVWDLTIDVRDLRDHGDVVLALGRISAQGRVSGAAFDSPVAYVAEFDDHGKVVKISSYLDHDEGIEAVASLKAG